MASAKTIASILFFFCCFLAPLRAADSIGISGSYRVGPGDVLQISVFEVEELSGPVVVGPGGTISLPLVGQVEVEGRTSLEIEARLREVYSQDLLRDPQISVHVEEFRSQPVSVLGAVERPGIYQLQGARRLLEVLAMAGGLTKEVGKQITITRTVLAAPEAREPVAAAVDDVSIGRPATPQDGVSRQEEIQISVADLLLGREPAGNPFLVAHDVIRVAAARLVYVLGAVVKPGGFPISGQDSVSVLRALSLAEGLARNAAPQKAMLIRESEGVKTEIPVAVQSILRGDAPDPAMQGNDILFIPDSRAKTALLRSAEAAIQMATGIVIWRR